jgi:hypothetical protein
MQAGCISEGRPRLNKGHFANDDDDEQSLMD